eukprot:COSAG02_NODE_36170_length_458_cov_0.793872_1_plen_67_part_00
MIEICLRACRVLLHNDGDAPLTIHGLEPAAGSEAFVSAYAPPPSTFQYLFWMPLTFFKQKTAYEIE